MPTRRGCSRRAAPTTATARPSSSARRAALSGSGTKRLRGRRAVAGLDWLRRNTRTIQIVGGVLMILVGVILVTGAWNVFVGWIRQWTLQYGATVI